jgi:hypothetical protein
VSGGPVVTIFCDGPNDERHPRYIIGQYQQYLVGRATAWFPLDRWSYDGRSGRTVNVTQRYFVDDAPQDATPSVEHEKLRMQFRVACPRCRLDEKRKLDSEKDFVAALFDLFNRMASGGHPEVAARLLVELALR